MHVHKFLKILQVFPNMCRTLKTHSLVLASSPIVLCVCVFFVFFRAQFIIPDGVQHQMRIVNAVLSGCLTSTHGSSSCSSRAVLMASHDPPTKALHDCHDELHSLRVRSCACLARDCVCQPSFVTVLGWPSHCSPELLRAFASSSRLWFPADFESIDVCALDSLESLRVRSLSLLVGPCAGGQSATLDRVTRLLIDQFV